MAFWQPGKAPETPLRLVLETAVENRPYSRDMYHEFLRGAIKTYMPGMVICAYSNKVTAAMPLPPLAAGPTLCASVYMALRLRHMRILQKHPEHRIKNGETRLCRLFRAG